MIICDLLCWKLLSADVHSGWLVIGAEEWWWMRRTEEKVLRGSEGRGKSWQGMEGEYDKRFPHAEELP